MTGEFTIEVTRHWDECNTFTEQAVEVIFLDNGFKYLKKGCKRFLVNTPKTRRRISFKVYNASGKLMASYNF